MEITELIPLVRQWGWDKGITGINGTGTMLAQLNKSQEELTETRDAAVMLLHDCESNSLSHLEELKDGIGDTTVTLILAADLAGLTFEECLQAAYEAISKRTGKMVGGQFVKDGTD
jgi:hypothetical protein